MKWPTGWGVVVDGSPIRWAGGVTPDQIVRRSRKRGQYILLLETVAQIFGVFLFWPQLSLFYSFILPRLCGSVGADEGLLARCRMQRPHQRVLVRSWICQCVPCGSIVLLLKLNSRMSQASVYKMCQRCVAGSSYHMT